MVTKYTIIDDRQQQKTAQNIVRSFSLNISLLGHKIYIVHILEATHEHQSKNLARSHVSDIVCPISANMGQGGVLRQRENRPSATSLGF